MKIKRKVLTVLLEKFSCKEWKKEITELLISTHKNKIDISSKLHRLEDCNENQLFILSTYGIVKGEKAETSSIESWLEKKLDKPIGYYYLDVDNRGFKIRNVFNGSGSPLLREVFLTQKEAELSRRQHNLYLQMKYVVKRMNQEDEFGADWENGNSKVWGLKLKRASVVVDYYYTHNNFIYGLVVSSKERAKQLLDYFGKEIKEVYGN